MDTSVVLNTALETAAAVAPVVLAANPQLAAVAALAPVALQLLQSAMTLQQAGVMTPQELASLFQKVGAGIADTHAQWEALNAADVPK